MSGTSVSPKMDSENTTLQFFIIPFNIFAELATCPRSVFGSSSSVAIEERRSTEERRSETPHSPTRCLPAHKIYDFANSGHSKHWRAARRVDDGNFGDDHLCHARPGNKTLSTTAELNPFASAGLRRASFLVDPPLHEIVRAAAHRRAV